MLRSAVAVLQASALAAGHRRWQPNLARPDLTGLLLMSWKLLCGASRHEGAHVGVAKRHSIHSRFLKVAGAVIHGGHTSRRPILGM